MGPFVSPWRADGIRRASTCRNERSSTRRGRALAADLPPASTWAIVDPWAAIRQTICFKRGTRLSAREVLIVTAIIVSLCIILAIVLL